MSLRFGTYTEFQCPPGRDHAELIWDVIEVGVQADQLGFGTFTCLEHPWFEQFAINAFPLRLFCALAAADEQHPLPDALPHAPAAQPDGARGPDRAGRHPAQRPPRRRGRAGARLAQRAGEHRLDENVERYPGVPRDPAQGLDRGPLLVRGQVLPVPRPAGRAEAGAEAAPADLAGRARARSGFRARVRERLGHLPRRARAEHRLRGADRASTTRPSRRRARRRTSATSRPSTSTRTTTGRSRRGASRSSNFIHFNVSPMDSLPRTTPEEKQRLIDAGYEFYAGDDFPNTRNLTYEQLLEYEIVYAGSPEKVGRQLIELLGPVPLRRVPADRALRRHAALAGDEDPGAVREEGRADAARGRREELARRRGRSRRPATDIVSARSCYGRLTETRRPACQPSTVQIEAVRRSAHACPAAA